MAGWRAPAPAPSCTRAHGTPGKCCRDFLRAAAPGRNLRNWPCMNYIRAAAGLGLINLLSDDRGRGLDRDRDHDRDCDTSSSNAAALLSTNVPAKRSVQPK